MGEVYDPLPIFEQRIAHPPGEESDVQGAVSPDAANRNGASPAGQQALVDDTLLKMGESTIEFVINLIHRHPHARGSHSKHRCTHHHQ